MATGKLRNLYKSAAARWVAVAGTLAAAIAWAVLQQPAPYTCKRFNRDNRAMFSKSRRVHVFMAIKDSVTIPVAFADTPDNRTIGRMLETWTCVADEDCIDTDQAACDTCCNPAACVTTDKGYFQIKSADCPKSWRYRWQRGPAWGPGWQMYLIRAPRHFAKSLRLWAASVGASNARYFKSYKDAQAECLASGFGAAVCRNQLTNAGSCWCAMGGDGACDEGDLRCMEGQLWGDGNGGFTTCTPDATHSPFPCASGSGPEWPYRVVQETYGDD